MPTRTVRFIGVATGPNPKVQVTMDFDGDTVFDGELDTVPASTDPWTTRAKPLFTFPLDTSVTGNVPVSISVTGGDVVFINLYANYVRHYRDAIQEFLPDQYFGPMNQHTDDDDGRTDIRIDGRPRPRNWMPDPATDAARPGDWAWVIPDGSMYTCQFRISELVTDPLPPIGPVETPQEPPTPSLVTPKPLHANHRP